MCRGKIATVCKRGFGFICSDWKQVFSDELAVEKGRFRLQRPGDEVEYELTPDNSVLSVGPQAYSLRPVSKGALCVAHDD